MGTDIEIHVELRVRGVWEHWSAPHVDRDYRLFTRMAGVRSKGREEEPIFKPKGLPGDMSLLTSMAAGWEGPDARVPSWLSRDELRVLQLWWEEHIEAELQARRGGGRSFETEIMGGYLHGDSYTGNLPGGIEDVRVVFWFSNP